MDDQSIYQFNVEKLNGEEISLERYQNKVLLIVNTASECGFAPQLKDLETLRKDFEGKDFEILAFPSNDFGGQEPLDGEAISTFCELNHDTHYTIFSKIRVRGQYAHPLYKFLADKSQNGHVKSTPKWNFHKYLISPQGKVVDFFYPFTKPTSSKIKKRIERLLSSPK
ncbi:glutathione peroxidase [Mucilaginibacter paludis]|uniref:Glutathione peroxidase n=1 Tax=Mucilaginibacter paludis DSM 18603 TaxID=714943 RepID=H1Y5T5_9SPHI|nr:glutathione peroxidase [Mucilaginibacter paludis]EHQ29861.1 glutathione peroxidase [Mucilaginibacter paludis DSM 18603]